ncbi:DUF1600 domain-containing protein [[Mycoplasma] testudinis]|uniref:DUF1600 domain-containing protein n=1 Tax=[Mycoplasma] testudinis TaxID=33924 RepID=UPI000696F8EA|nr:DUF1600 domain-containing protein [[Mycoplasma] testudinis]
MQTNNQDSIRSRAFGIGTINCPIRKYFKEFDRIRWAFFVGLLFFVVSTAFVLKAFVDNLMVNEVRLGSDGRLDPIDGWTVFDKFTNQSNVLLLIFAIFIVFFPKHQFLKNNKFLLATMVYIWFTFFGYNIVLSATGGAYGIIATQYDLAVSIWQHVITDILFLVLGFLKMFWDPNSRLKSYWTTMLPGMIYPSLYLIYAASIPVVFNHLNHDNFIDSNNFLAAIHEKNPNFIPVYSVYGSATDVVNNPAISGPAIAIMYIIFFPGSFAIVYYAYWGIQKHLGPKIPSYAKAH